MKVTPTQILLKSNGLDEPSWVNLARNRAELHFLNERKTKKLIFIDWDYHKGIVNYKLENY